ncbi:MAG: hypothetical protein WBL80_02870 [Erysipelotrichaceae bacterium]
MITIKTENGLMICSFEVIRIEAYNSDLKTSIPENERWLLGKIVLNGYLVSGRKIMLRAFDQVSEATNTLNAIYAGIPHAISLSLEDMPQSIVEKPLEIR